MTAQLGPIFRRAAEVLRERGHCKGHLVGPDGSVCAHGALSVALKDCGATGLAPTVAQRLLRDELARATGSRRLGPMAVPQWNDEPERTQADVEKLFLLAADRADIQGAS
jgi:hypothetical protein